MLKNFLLALLGLLFLGGCPPFVAPVQAADVQVERVANGGLQPQMVARNGAWHLVYFKGETGAGDLILCEIER